MLPLEEIQPPNQGSQQCAQRPFRIHIRAEADGLSGTWGGECTTGLGWRVYFDILKL